MERIVKRDRGLKVTVIAGDNTSEFESNWDGFAKAIRDEQTGVLLGSLKEQNLFGVKIPYGVQEKELEKGDGYFIVKNKFTSLRVGIAKD